MSKKLVFLAWGLLLCVLATACGSSPANPDRAEAFPVESGPVQTEPGSVSLPNPEEATLSNPEVLGSLLPDSATATESDQLVVTAASQSSYLELQPA